MNDRVIFRKTDLVTWDDDSNVDVKREICGDNEAVFKASWGETALDSKEWVLRGETESDTFDTGIEDFPSHSDSFGMTIQEENVKIEVDQQPEMNGQSRPDFSTSKINDAITFENEQNRVLLTLKDEPNVVVDSFCLTSSFGERGSAADDSGVKKAKNSLPGSFYSTGKKQLPSPVVCYSSNTNNMTSTPHCDDGGNGFQVLRSETSAVVESSGLISAPISEDPECSQIKRGKRKYFQSPSLPDASLRGDKLELRTYSRGENQQGSSQEVSKKLHPSHFQDLDEFLRKTDRTGFCPLCPGTNIRSKRLPGHVSKHTNTAVYHLETAVCPCFNRNCLGGSVTRHGHYHCLCGTIIRRKQRFQRHTQVCPLRIQPGKTTPKQEKCPIDGLVIAEKPKEQILSPEHDSSKTPATSQHHTKVDPLRVQPERTTPKQEKSPKDGLVIAEKPKEQIPTPKHDSSKTLATSGADSAQQEAASVSSRIKPSTVCHICRKTVSKKNIKRHGRTHSSLGVCGNISALRHHRSLLVDVKEGIYLVNKSHRGPDNPVHVQVKISASSQRIECEVDQCRKMADEHSRSGIATYQCPHIISAAFASSASKPPELGNAVLQRMVDEQLITQETMQLCLQRKGQCQELGVPLVVLWEQHEQKDALFFSVFHGQASDCIGWSRFGRTLVTLSKVARRLKCRCSSSGSPCVHAAICKWYISQYLPDHNLDLEGITDLKESDSTDQ